VDGVVGGNVHLARVAVERQVAHSPRHPS
jgi:hypothetical protein